MKYLLDQAEYDKLQTEAARYRDSVEDTRDLETRALEFKQHMIELLVEQLPDLIHQGSFRTLETTLTPFINKIKAVKI